MSPGGESAGGGPSRRRRAAGAAGERAAEPGGQARAAGAQRRRRARGRPGGTRFSKKGNIKTGREMRAAGARRRARRQSDDQVTCISVSVKVVQACVLSEHMAPCVGTSLHCLLAEGWWRQEATGFWRWQPASPPRNPLWLCWYLPMQAEPVRAHAAVVMRSLDRENTLNTHDLLLCYSLNSR